MTGARNTKRLLLRAATGLSIAAVLVGLALFATVQGYVVDPAAKRSVASVFAPNFGEVSEGIYRSGQMTPPFLDWVWRTYRFRTVIHLAWSGRPTDLSEERVLSANGVVFRKFSWDPGGPPDPVEMRAALESLEHDPRPVLIHCRAGRDRTGGLVGYWRSSRGSSIEDVKRDWVTYGDPSPGWQRALEENATHPLTAE